MSELKNKVEEPSPQGWGGTWTEIKLQAFIDYVIKYLIILNRFPKYKTIYFDGFAGTGEAIFRKKKSPDLFDFDIENQPVEELNIYQGSVARVLNLQVPYLFDYYYFIETNDASVQSLEKIKKTIKHIPQKRIIIRKENCNKQLLKLSKALKINNYAALILLDPFGMQINWNSIKALKETHSDIWILIPSGVAINRLLDHAKKINAIKKLEDFFGFPESEIRNIFYPELRKETLFGTETTSEKIKQPINKIIEVYRKQLKTVWNNVSEPLILRNSKNNPIFHFIFASNNTAGLRIANYIIEKSSRKK